MWNYLQSHSGSKIDHMLQEANKAVVWLANTPPPGTNQTASKGFLANCNAFMANQNTKVFSVKFGARTPNLSPFFPFFLGVEGYG